MIFFDLDRFKAVNDTLGHKAGDHLLTCIARRLSAAVRAKDTAARLGGDEFLVLVEHITSTSEAYALASRLIQAVQQPVTVDGTILNPRVSVGVAVSDIDGNDPEALLRAADHRMYHHKQSGEFVCPPAALG